MKVCGSRYRGIWRSWEKPFPRYGKSIRLPPPGLNDLPGSVALRNFLIHVYHAIDDEKIWDTTVSDLPDLIEQLERLLNELDDD
ncbi:DUF86 domain-containing protein [bacterium]|nr:MAG: DUF86 domain-containing protein [bacterium]